MSIKVNYNNMMSRVLGKRGITDEELNGIEPLLVKARNNVEEIRGQGMSEWMLCPYVSDEEILRIERVAENVRKKCDAFVVLGIGGSALGATALFGALKHLYYNELPDKVRKAPRFYVIDNADPERMNALFDVIDTERTVFNVITKSGATSETMSQYLIVMHMLTEKLGDKARERIITTTSENKGNLIKLAKQQGFTTFYIPDGVGGRFSVLSPVGLFPASVIGINIRELLAGARETDEKCKTEDTYRNPALIIAGLQYLAMKQGKNISVMMPYADSLRYFSDWYAQLWAESLGKECDRNGKTVNAGQTPVKALGVTDQHSQVQLYNEGPYDKVVTFLEVENFRSDCVIPNGCEEYPDVNFLCGHSLAELMNNELFATRYNLTRCGRMNYTVSMDKVDERNVGSLIYLLQMQTAYAGELLNIDAYNQPGVEGGKNATYALFGRKGYENTAREMENAVKDSGKYII
ncbi:MAG: glucose-6-phosphate isomerase [Corallococcus sp.]|nr:glucose-6-phosphate isomerase [Bacillota bacterium]MCM1533817.1 glucose-6-phosphate isomerase [Corallococcus sp.]